MYQNLGLKRDELRIENYNPKWKKLFIKEKNRLLDLFDNYIIQIEHIGSTSVVGMSSKPIIDIGILTQNIDTLPYQNFDNNYFELVGRLKGRQRVFIKKEEDLNTHHIHFIEYGEDAWNRKLKFRDLLIKYEDLRLEYSKLKTQLKNKYQNDRALYSEGKTEFIVNTINNF
ncbi:GrpB family protein [Winogradskyella litorisediminis]|uniref:GrpB family protein n=1 Tax=Winogradskyella litorisediminis TaxID=1156618 RepID=A0ABW3NCR0_9FLAO